MQCEYRSCTHREVDARGGFHSVKKDAAIRFAQLKLDACAAIALPAHLTAAGILGRTVPYEYNERCQVRIFLHLRAVRLAKTRQDSSCKSGREGRRFNPVAIVTAQLEMLGADGR